MSARILDGKAIASTLREETSQAVAKLMDQHGIQPQLVAILVGDDPASQVYVKNKEIACRKAGIASRVLNLPATTSIDQLLDLLDDLSSSWNFLDVDLFEGDADVIELALESLAVAAPLGAVHRE